jgi:hypothetical protein
MKRPRVRFTLLQMMIAVAVVCVILGAENFRRRRAFCLGQARYHRDNDLFWNGNHIGHGYGFTPRGQRPTAPDLEKLQWLRKKDLHLDWHWRLAERYERAAFLPWLATPSESPCPGWDYFYAQHVKLGLIANP